MLLDALQELDAVHAGHLDVTDHDVEGLHPDLLQRVATTVHGRDLVALLAQHDPQELGHALFVVDHQDLLGRHDITSLWTGFDTHAAVDRATTAPGSITRAVVP